eukprot:gene9604-9765_t
MSDLEQQVTDQKKLLDDLEDASNELMLADDDEVVRMRVGECFWGTEKSAAEEQIEQLTVDAKQQLQQLEHRVADDMHALGDLRTKLYANLGHQHLDPSCRPVIALGKFDAMHKGHQALAAAALQLGGFPVMLSFSGMAAVLGWPPRRPLRYISFSAIRAFSPQEFVDLLVQDLGAAGVVCGANYRFGERAASNSLTGLIFLMRSCE